MKILFSGIQPSGEIHLGNYLGALKNWVDLQNQYRCFYSIVDLHAITVDYDPAQLQARVLNTAMDLLAIGIDPKKSTLFIQSAVPEHTELTWLFNTLTPISELERMTQFKDKAIQHKQNINAGLFDYPVLQAADILLYQSEVVPVGEDQLQHLELTNTILRKFNHKFGNYFKEVKPIVGQGARIMSLTDPTKKMSKSLGPNNLIALSDEPKLIIKKIRKAVTDSKPIKANYMGKEESFDVNFGVRNLYKIFQNIDPKQWKSKNYRRLGYSELKNDLAEAIINYLTPIQERKKKLNKNKVQKILAEGAKKARQIAQRNILEIKKKMGLL
jgi:tryptophanyl-tRNA synthetase